MKNLSIDVGKIIAEEISKCASKRVRKMFFTVDNHVVSRSSSIYEFTRQAQEVV